MSIDCKFKGGQQGTVGEPVKNSYSSSDGPEYNRGTSVREANIRPPQNGYTCNFCSREYKEKFNYDRHHVYCEFAHKSAREQNNQIETAENDNTLPSIRQMYQWMQEMAVKIDKLEKENIKLKQAITKKQKINIIDWLNNSKHLEQLDVTFVDWITNDVFPLIPTVLEQVYKNGLLFGINELLKKSICDNVEKMPIRAFDHKLNTFYAYMEQGECERLNFGGCNGAYGVVTDPESGALAYDSVGDSRRRSWNIISTNDFDKQIARISHQFIVEFSRCWFSVNQAKIETDEKYKDLYITYYQQIMGGTKLTDETRYAKVRQAFYSAIKQNSKNIIEYDFIVKN